MDNNIGKYIHKVRKEKKLTLEQVADYVGVGSSTLSKWERGAIKNMGRDKIPLLSSILEIDPLIFIRGIDNETLSISQFKQETIILMNKCPTLSDNKKQMLIANLNFICEEEKD